MLCRCWLDACSGTSSGTDIPFLLRRTSVLHVILTLSHYGCHDHTDHTMVAAAAGC
jgi:hypothetical protein